MVAPGGGVVPPHRVGALRPTDHHSHPGRRTGGTGNWWKCKKILPDIKDQQDEKGNKEEEEERALEEEVGSVLVVPGHQGTEGRLEHGLVVERLPAHHLVK